MQGIEADCAARIRRKENGEPMRFLLTIGGAGAQKEIFAAIIKFLLPYIEKKQAALYVNVGDYRNVWEALLAEIPEMKNYAQNILIVGQIQKHLHKKHWMGRRKSKGFTVLAQKYFRGGILHESSHEKL